MMYYPYVALEMFEVSRPGLQADGRDSLCGVSLWAPLFWSVQPVADTQGKRQDRLACLDSPSLFLLLNLKALFLKGFPCLSKSKGACPYVFSFFNY